MLGARLQNFLARSGTRAKSRGLITLTELSIAAGAISLIEKVDESSCLAATSLLLLLHATFERNGSSVVPASRTLTFYWVH